MPTKELYGLASEYRKTKLWEHLNDSELFAVQMPEGEVGYISVMGALGTHIALAVYPGTEGLESLWKIWQGLEGLRAAERNERMLSQDCVMCSFDDKAELLPRDLNEIAAYGLNFRGKKAYPHFQRFRPLHHPWFVKDAYDEERLRLGLLAGIEVARKLNEVPLQLNIFQTPNQGTSKEVLGLREGRPFGREIPLLTSQADGTFEWGRLMLPDYVSPTFEAPRFANEIARTKLNKKPKTGTWACSVFVLPHPTAVDEEGDFEDLENAPVYPLSLVIIDHESELILHWGMTTPSENSMTELLNAFVDGLLKCGVPSQIFVRDARTEALLLDVTKQLGILLKSVDDLPELDAMEEELIHMPEVGNERETAPELLQMLDSLDVEEMPEAIKDNLEEMLEHQLVQGEAAEKVRSILEKAAKPHKAQAKIIPIDKKAKPIQGGRKAKQMRVYVISVSLGKGCYRHIRISGKRTLKDLHEMILDAFDFVDDHAHAFFMDNRVWSGEADYYSDLIDEAERFTSDFRLDRLSLTVGKPFKYVFDFGDEWRFQCKVIRFTEGEEGEEGVIRMVGTAPPQYESEGAWGDGDGDGPDMLDSEPVQFPEIYAPSKLKKLYEKLQLSEETVQLLHNYFSAAANLYGLVSLRKTLEIYNAQNEPLSEDQFSAFAEIVRHERHLYFVMGADELIDEAEPVGPMDREIIEESLLLDDVDDYLDMKEQQAGKPFYVPPKGELLKYADDLYYEKTPQFFALKNYLEHQMHCKNAADLADELQLMASTGETDMGFVMDDMARMGLTFSEIDDLQRFLNLYTDMSNHSRIHYNRGYMPVELSGMSPDADKFRSIRLGPNVSNALRSGEMDLEDMRKAIWKMEFPNQELKASYLSELDRIEREKRSLKIGRNDPCPCGSGKKYKHCCGRNS